MICERNIYRLFADVADYGEAYWGVQKIVGKGNGSAGRVMLDCAGVVLGIAGKVWFDPLLVNCFAQIRGMFGNCMTSRSNASLYIVNEIER